MPNEFAPGWYVLRYLAAHRLGQTAIPPRTSRELLDILGCHAGAPQKHGTYLILSSKLRHLGWKKVDTFDDIVLGHRVDTPDKPFQIGKEPFRIRPECLGSGVPLRFYTFHIRHTH